MRVELHPDARAELRSAALWYDEQRPGLSDEFLAEVCQHVVVLAVAHARRQPLYWLTRTNPRETMMAPGSDPRLAAPQH